MKQIILTLFFIFSCAVIADSQKITDDDGRGFSELNQIEVKFNF
jgi:hypothetical protein